MRGLEIDLPSRVTREHGAVIRGWAQHAIPGAFLSIFLGDERMTGPASRPSARYLEEHTADLVARELEPGVLVIQPADKDSARLIEAAELRYRAKELSNPANDAAPAQSAPRCTFLPSWAVFPGLDAEAA